MANQYICDLSRNVKRGLAEKVRLGEYPGARPIGYVTDPKSKMMVIDPEPASFIRRAFHLYATENYATERIADTLYDEGFRSRLGNKVGKSTIYRMLTNPIYAGLFLWKGQTHKGIHEPIVSLALFDAVEKQLMPKKHLKREQTTRIFTYRGFLVCGECGLKVTAEVKKGHTYYRCTKSRGVKKCSQCYTREETLEKVLGAELGKDSFR
jgi:site-specific DNA recombinase